MDTDYSKYTLITTNTLMVTELFLAILQEDSAAYCVSKRFKFFCGIFFLLCFCVLWFGHPVVNGMDHQLWQSQLGSSLNLWNSVKLTLRHRDQCFLAFFQPPCICRQVCRKEGRRKEGEKEGGEGRREEGRKEGEIYVISYLYI